MIKRYIAKSSVVIALLGAAGLAAAGPYDADIRWTQYGVPHIKAKDYASLGYGYGYAVAKDRLCLLADRVITLRGERSRWFGATGAATVGFLPASNLNSDLFHRVQLSDELVATASRKLSADARALSSGYAAGFTRYVSELKDSQRTAACKGAPIPQMKESDVVRAMMSIGTLWKAFQVAPFASTSTWGSGSPPPAAAAISRPPVPVGSNAWAYGAEATRTGSAMVMANPHTYWQNSFLLMHQMHLTIPGRIDVAGADFAGLPLPVVGFNADLAWSIEAPSTVTYFVLQKMQIETAPQPVYIVDGKRRPLKIVPVAIDVKQTDGAVVAQSFALPWSELGVLYKLPAVPGRPEGWYAVTDAGEGNALGLDQMLGIAKAKSVTEFRDATARYRGLGSHLIAGDRHGDALYIEAGPLLGVDDALLKQCAVPNARFNVLDGSRAECFARDRNGEPLLAPPARLPALITRGIVQNTNNSYHLSLHGKPVNGYSQLLGEAGQHDLRIQMSERRMKEISADGRVTPEEAVAVVYDNRSYAAESWLDTILQACKETNKACTILKAWDRTNNTTSRGTLLFETLWERVSQIPEILPPFDPQAPFAVRTMNHSAPALVAIAKAMEDSLADLQSKGLTGDEPWGEILSTQGAHGRIRLHGGSSDAGVLNTLGGDTLGRQGYASIVSGSAYLQLVRWEGDRVRADVVLAHGQSLDPASPHHTDQLELFAGKTLVPMPFYENDIQRAAALKTLRLR